MLDEWGAKTRNLYQPSFLAVKSFQFKAVFNLKGSVFLGKRHFYVLVEALSGASHHLPHLFSSDIYFIRP